MAVLVVLPNRPGHEVSGLNRSRCFRVCVQRHLGKAAQPTRKDGREWNELLPVVLPDPRGPRNDDPTTSRMRGVPSLEPLTETWMQPCDPVIGRMDRHPARGGLYHQPRSTSGSGPWLRPIHPNTAGTRAYHSREKARAESPTQTRPSSDNILTQKNRGFNRQVIVASPTSRSNALCSLNSLPGPRKSANRSLRAARRDSPGPGRP